REPADRLETAGRRCRARLGGSPDVLVERREREEDLRARPPPGLLEDVDVPYDERSACHDRERRPAGVELGEAGAREPEPAVGGLVRVGRGPERDLLALPRASGELAPEDLGDVRLDPDRASVAVVRGAVRTLLEVPDVAERAPVGTPHVRVERPTKR